MSKRSYEHAATARLVALLPRRAWSYWHDECAHSRFKYDASGEIVEDRRDTGRSKLVELAITAVGVLAAGVAMWIYDVGMWAAIGIVGGSTILLGLAAYVLFGWTPDLEDDDD